MDNVSTSDSHQSQQKNSTNDSAAEVAYAPLTSSDKILRLQQVVGNQAVIQMMREGNIEQAKPKSSTFNPSSLSMAWGNISKSTSTSIQRIMSFEEFQLKTRQITKTQTTKKKSLFRPKKVKTTQTTHDDKVDIMSGKMGYEALRADRIALIDEHDSAQADVNVYYKLYEANPTLPNLIKLYNQITYWITLNAGREWLSESQGVLNEVMAQIKAEVVAETAKQGGGKTGGVAVDQLAKPGEKPSKKQPMPAFMREVGIAQNYFDENIAGKQAIIDQLEIFYNALKADQDNGSSKGWQKAESHLTTASKAWAAVKDKLPTSYIIRSLFLSHFPKTANLGKVVNTDYSKLENKDLTQAELAAIIAYTNNDFIAMNTGLRDHDTKASGPMIGKNSPKKDGKHNKQNNMKGRMSEEDAKKVDKHDKEMTKNKLAVSGLNKLPKYEGILYRVITNAKTDFMDGIAPGGVVADLGFSSASPSMEGVDIYSNDEGVWFILKVKTAVNIIKYSINVREAEILIRPGTRFRVDAVWQHLDGKVPSDAPAEAQMILHSKGEFDETTGRDKPFKNSVIEVTEI